MKALSIQQPWAWFIIRGYKNIENRTWATTYRGPLLIHASKTLDEDAEDYLISILFNEIDDGSDIYTEYLKAKKWNELLSGGIIGSVNLYKITSNYDNNSPWFFGPIGWYLRDPKPIKFIPYRGMPGIFNIPDKLIVEK